MCNFHRRCRKQRDDWQAQEKRRHLASAPRHPWTDTGLTQWTSNLNDYTPLPPCPDTAGFVGGLVWEPTRSCMTLTFTSGAWTPAPRWAPGSLRPSISTI